VIKSTSRRDEVRNSRTDQEQTYVPDTGHTAAGSQLWTCGGPRESMDRWRWVPVMFSVLPPASPSRFSFLMLPVCPCACVSVPAPPPVSFYRSSSVLTPV